MERSCIFECICVLYDFVLINYVLLEIIDDLINILVMFCWNSIIVEFFIRERVRNSVRKIIIKVNVKENYLGFVLKSCIKCFILNVYVKD